MGLRVFAEVKTNIGRIDIVIEDRGSVFLFEFKFNGTKEEAIAQVKKNKYFEKYFSPHVGTHDRVPVRLFGVEFTDKTVGEWMMEEL
jgi:RecB family endonuclease NucS